MAVLRLGPAADIAPAAGSSNNVDPGVDPTSINRLRVDTAAGNATFTGLLAGSDGQLLWVLNEGTNTLTLANASGSSTAANQFQGSGDIVIAGGDSLLIYYDGDAARWIIGV